MKRSYVMHDWDVLRPLVERDLQTMDLMTVSKRHGVNYHTLLEYCHRNKIARPVRKKREKKVHTKDYPKVRKLYNAGYDEEMLAKRFDVSVRQVNVALNNIFVSKSRAVCWWHKRVSTTLFRMNIGEVLDTVYRDGAVIMTNTKRGESVLMTADKYNKLIEDQKELQSLKAKMHSE